MLAVSAVESHRQRATILMIMVAGLAYAPLMWDHATDLWSRPRYQFFPFAVLGAAILAVSRWGTVGSRQRGYGWLSGLGWLTSVAGLVVAVLLQSPWLGFASVLIALLTLAYRSGGGLLLGKLLPSWILLGLTIPLPLDLDRRAVESLRLGTSQAASAFLDHLAVYHNLLGTVIEVDGHRLLVAEACSGAHSFLSLVPLTIFYAFWRGRHWLSGTLLVIAAIIWTLLANVARIVAIAVVTDRWQIDVISGWQHDALGMLVSLVAIGAIFSTDHLLIWLGSYFSGGPCGPEPRTEDEEESNDAAARPVLRPLAVPRLVVSGIVIYGALALFQGAVVAHRMAGDVDERALEPVDFETLGDEFLPSKSGDWQRVAYDQVHRDDTEDIAVRSQSWQYYIGDQKALVSLDYPYHEPHDLTLCYRNQGWILDEKNFQEDPAHGSRVAARFHMPVEQYAHLSFQAFDTQGRPLVNTIADPRGESFLDRIKSRLEPFLRLSLEAFEVAQRTPSYQVQLFVVGNRPLTVAEEEEIASFYQQTVARFSHHRAETSTK